MKFLWHRALTVDEQSCCVETVEAENLLHPNTEGFLVFHLHGEKFSDVKISVGNR